MRKIFAILFGSFLVYSCSDENCNRPGLVCTEELRFIFAEIKNENGVNIFLDSTKTSNPNGHLLYSQQQSDTETFSFHTVISDSEIDQVGFDGTELTFEGWLGGEKVVSETYVIAKDCCHIEKLMGPDIIIIP